MHMCHSAIVTHIAILPASIIIFVMKREHYVSNILQLMIYNVKAILAVLLPHLSSGVIKQSMGMLQTAV